MLTDSLVVDTSMVHELVVDLVDQLQELELLQIHVHGVLPLRAGSTVSGRREEGERMERRRESQGATAIK